MLVKIDIHCRVQGDVVLECVHLDEDLVHEEMMFRLMFHTAFVRSSILILNRDEIDVLWDAKDQFPKDFRAEVSYCYFSVNVLSEAVGVEFILICVSGTFFGC